MKVTILILLSLLQLLLHAQPVISSFAPASGPVGSSVTITGAGFSSTPSNNIVFFGAVAGTVTAASATSLTAVVPAGASHQFLTVTVNGLTAYARNPFRVTFPGGGIIATNSFAARQDISSGTYVNLAMAVKDLNADGKADIITRSYTGGAFEQKLTVFRNTSSISSILLAAADTFNTNTASNHYYIETSDIDGDGKPDVLTTTTEEANFTVYKNSGAAGAIAFASRVNIASFASPKGIATADFDGDGKPDVVITNYDFPGLAGVHRNTSAGGTVSFAPKVDFATGDYPTGVAVAFVDADSKPDIIVASYSSASFSVLRNTSTPGNISFAPKVDFAAPATSLPYTIAAGDFNGDGNADVVLSCNNNGGGVGSIAVFQNTGTGSTINFAPFIELVTTAVNMKPYLVAANDIDGDGKPDIAVTHQGISAISVFRNNSSGGMIAFNPKVDFFANSSNRNMLALNDLNGDGKPELITGSGFPNVISVFKNTADIPRISSFSPANGCAGSAITITGYNFTGTTAVSFGGVAASSFTVNADTSVTAIIGAGATGDVALTTAVGAATMSGFIFTTGCVLPPSITAVSPETGTIGTDITIQGQNFSTVPSNNIVYFGGIKAVVASASATSLTVKVPRGAGSFSITVTVNNRTAYSPRPFNYTFSGSNLCQFFNANAFILSPNFAAGANPHAIVLADMDGNGMADAAVSNFLGSSISLLRNTGTPGTISFAAPADTAVGSQPESICYGDIDGDGKLDIATTSYAANTFSVLRNTGSPGTVSYAAAVSFTTGTSPFGIFIRDLDKDGLPDVVVANSQANTVSVFRNTSTGTGVISFAAALTYAVGSQPVAIFVDDFDGDGKPDIAAANEGSYYISLYRNTTGSPGNLSFASEQVLPGGTQPCSLYSFDLNGDNKPELVAGNCGVNGGLDVFKNTGSPGTISFASRQSYITAEGAPSVAVADLNGDKKPDIAAVKGLLSNRITVLKNSSNTATGNIIFFDETVYPANFFAKNLTLSDADNDGRPDIITANSNGSSITVLKNKVEEIPGMICPGGSTVLTANVTGTVYQWQLNTGSGFVNIADNADFYGTGSKVLIINGAPTAWRGYQFRCMVDGATAFSNITSITFKNTWLGTVDNTWGNPGNWSCSQVPDAKTDVIVTCGANVNVNINAICRSLSQTIGTTVTVLPGFILTVTN